MAQRRGSARARQAGGKAWGFIWTLIVIGLALAFLNVNGIRDVDSALTYFRTVGQDTSQVTQDKVNAAVARSCNFVVDPTCLYSHDVQQKIGDVNKDGVINDDDSKAYAKQYGTNLPADTANTPTGSTTGGATTTQKPTTTPTDPSKAAESEYLTKLDALKVAEPDGSDYSRSDYKHWVTVEGKCDAREESLKKVGFSTDPKTCRAEKGYKYTDPYTDKVVDDPAKLDIDHVIPLGRANDTGAKSWSPEKKQQYANDVDTVLLPVDASANRQKGDKGPGEWMPANQKFHCEYSKKYVDIASKYGLWISQSDKDALKKGLQSCS